MDFWEGQAFGEGLSDERLGGGAGRKPGAQRGSGWERAQEARRWACTVGQVRLAGCEGNAEQPWPCCWPGWPSTGVGSPR